MDISQLTVEVRNRALERVCAVRPIDMDLLVEIADSGKGEFTLTLPLDSPAASHMRMSGSGLVISYDGDEIFSGFTSRPETFYGPDRYAGQATFKGVGDSVVLDERLTYPQPSNANVATQTADTDKRVDYAENIMHGYVAANIGPTAPEERRIELLQMGENEGRGNWRTITSRFNPISKALDVAAKGSNLGYRVIQRGDFLVFETYEIADKSQEIRLSVAGGSLKSSKLSVSGPGLTRAIVGGKGSGNKRVVREYTTDESEEAEDEWGRRIEKFIDQQAITAVSELENAGMAQLNAEGFTRVTSQAVPIDDSGLEFLRDWTIGDRVSVEFEGQELRALVTGAVLEVTDEGAMLGVRLGDSTTYDPLAAMVSRQRDAIADLQRTNLIAETPVEVIEESATTLVAHAERIAVVEASTASLDADASQFAADLAAVQDGLGEVQEVGWISGRLIEGDVIATALTGQRVQLSLSGVIAYDSSGTPVTTISADTGVLTASGANISGSLTTKDSSGNGFTTRTDPTWGGLLDLQAGGVSVGHLSAVERSAFYSGDGIALRGESYVELWSTTDPDDSGAAGFQLGDLTGNPSKHDVYVRGVDVQIRATGSTGTLYLYGGGSGTTNRISLPGTHAFQSGTGSSRALYINENSGYLHTASSSERFKDRIEPYAFSPEQIYALDTVSYVDKEQLRAALAGEIMLNADGEEMVTPMPVREIGVIAEQTHALGLDGITGYDHDGVTPADVDYARLVVPLIEVAKSLNARLARVESRYEGAA